MSPEEPFDYHLVPMPEHNSFGEVMDRSTFIQAWNLLITTARVILTTLIPTIVERWVYIKITERREFEYGFRGELSCR